MRRFEEAGRCPGCAELVHEDQGAVTFALNLEVPLGPPVTFHVGAARCRVAALEYQQAWLRRVPDAPELLDPLGQDE